MLVTACLAGQEDVDVEVGEDCRTLQALKEAVVKALPQLCVEGFDVSVGGRALDDDEGVVSLVESTCLDVVPNPRVLSIRALREAGRQVSEAGLLDASKLGDVPLCTLYLDAGVPIDCVDGEDSTPLHLACRNGHVSLATLLLDRGSRAIDEKTSYGHTPLYLACREGHLSVATLLLDRGSCALDMGHCLGITPLHVACSAGHLSVATLLLDRGSRAIDKKKSDDETPLYLACLAGNLSLAKLLLDRGSRAIDEKAWHKTPFQVACSRHRSRHHVALMRLLLDRGCYVDTEWWRSLRNQHSQEVAELVEEYGGCGASQGCS